MARRTLLLSNSHKWCFGVPSSLIIYLTVKFTAHQHCLRYFQDTCLQEPVVHAQHAFLSVHLRDGRRSKHDELEQKCASV